MTAEAGEDPVEIADSPCKPFQCDLCVRKFTCRSNLQRHINEIHGGQLQCETCLRNFLSAKDLELHQCPKYSCYLCEERYTHAISLKRHQKRVHFRESRKLIFCCYFCQMEFPRKYDVRHHKCNRAPSRPLIRSSAVVIRRIKKKYQCDMCKVVIVGKRNLRRHILSHIGLPKAMESKAIQTLHCDVCQKTFCRKDHLKTHIKAHRGSFRCNICLKNYYKFTYLKNHRCVDRHKKIFSCDQCDKTYINKWSLLTHQKEAHPSSVSTLYCCDLCELEFEHKPKLTRHQRNHPENRSADMDKKSFQCDVCETNFATKKYIRQHIKKHLEISQWHLCPKRSECKHNFKYHLRNHVPIVIMRCLNYRTNSAEK